MFFLRFKTLVITTYLINIYIYIYIILKNISLGNKSKIFFV